MQRVVTENGIEVWVMKEREGAAPSARCIEGESEVIVSLEWNADELPILGYIADLPSGKFLLRCVRVVKNHRREIMEKWQEFNS